MKTCPVCNDSFPDELNFCDVDGTRLGREASETPGNRGNWWSLLGAGLLVGAVVISAASIIFLPKARVSLPAVSSEPQSLPAASKAPVADSAATDSSATVAAATPASEPDASAADAVAPDLKKKDKVTANSNAGQAPNPKAAALAAEGVDSTASSNNANKNAASAANKSEPPPASKVSDTRPTETATRPAQAPADVKRDQKTPPVSAKSSDKGSDKKKSDDKEKKKGGFLRVFKKIFGKD